MLDYLPWILCVYLAVNGYLCYLDTNSIWESRQKFVNAALGALFALPVVVAIIARFAIEELGVWLKRKLTKRRSPSSDGSEDFDSYIGK